MHNIYSDTIVNPLERTQWIEYDQAKNLCDLALADKFQSEHLRDLWVAAGGVQVAFNTYSGCIWLVAGDEGLNCLVEEDGQLVEFYSTPYDGREGTLKQLAEDYKSNLADWDHEDYQYIKQEADNNGISWPIPKVAITL